MAGRLAVQAGMGAFKAARGLFRKDTTAADVDQPGTDKGLAKESKKSPGGTTRKMGMVDQTHIDDGLSPMDVPSGTTLHNSPQIKTALTDYANALEGTYDQLRGAQKQLNKKAPDFAQAERDVEAMANDMLGNDLRHLQAGLGLDKDTLHSWLISPTRSRDADPVIALKLHLTIELKEAGHSAPQSEAMAAWLFDQIMVAGSVCLTAQSSGDTARFKTYLQASVDHLHQAHHAIKDGAVVARLMDRWAAGQMDLARADERELIRALIRQAVANPEPKPTCDQGNTTDLVPGEKNEVWLTDGDQQPDQRPEEDKTTSPGSVHRPDKKMPGHSEQIKGPPLSSSDKSKGTKAPEKQGGSSKEKTPADLIGRVYPRVMETAEEGFRQALLKPGKKEALFFVGEKQPGKQPLVPGQELATYDGTTFTPTRAGWLAMEEHLDSIPHKPVELWSRKEWSTTVDFLRRFTGDPFQLSAHMKNGRFIRNDMTQRHVQNALAYMKEAVQTENRKAAQ